MSKSRLLKQYAGLLNTGSYEDIFRHLPKIEEFGGSPLLNVTMREELDQAIYNALQRDYGKEGVELLMHLTRISQMFRKE